MEDGWGELGGQVGRYWNDLRSDDFLIYLLMLAFSWLRPGSGCSSASCTPSPNQRHAAGKDIVVCIGVNVRNSHIVASLMLIHFACSTRYFVDLSESIVLGLVSLLAVMSISVPSL